MRLSLLRKEWELWQLSLDMIKVPSLQLNVKFPYATDVMTTGNGDERWTEFGKQSGFQRLEADSDSLSVINFCSRQNTWWDAMAAIFQNAWTLVPIEKVRFKHCFRLTNQTAHVLPNFSYCNKVSISWS